MPMISVEIMKTTDEKKNAKNNKTKANKDRPMETEAIVKG